MFGKKKIEEKVPETTPVEHIEVSRNPFKKTEPQLPPLPELQVTTEQVIAQNTELWYKTQIIEMQAEILEILREFKKNM